MKKITFSAGFALLLLTLFASQIAAQTYTVLLSNEGFSSWPPNNWSVPTGWYYSANGAVGADGSAVCDLWNYSSSPLSTPSLDASTYTSLTVDFDFCWEYNDYNTQNGDDEFDIVDNNGVLLQLFTSSAYTYSTTADSYDVDPPSGGSNWVHYSLPIPVSDLTSGLTISWQGVPNWGASNPAIDNVTISGMSNQTLRMSLSTNSIALGQVRVGSRAAAPLTLTSNGTGAITINSSAMQTGAQFSNYPTNLNRSINAGSSETDSAIFVPTSRGIFNDALIFTTNSDLASEQSMTVSVSGQGIQAIFSATNGTTVGFGNLPVGRMAQQTFSFSNTGDDTLFLKVPIISGSGFSIVSGPASLRILPNQTSSVIIQFAPTVQQPYNGTLTFTASNGVTAPTITLSGTGTLPRIQISNSASFGKLRVGRMLQGTVTFTNTGNDILTIADVSLIQPSPRFALGAYDQSVLPGGTGTFHIFYSPNQRGLDSVNIHFTTDDPSHINDSVVISGQGIQAVFSSANGTTIPFDNLYVGRTATQRYPITNSGDDTLFLQTLLVAGNGFSIVSGPASLVLLPNQTDIIPVQFAPTVKQPYNGTLTFTTLNGVPTPTIILSGNGTLPLIRHANAANMGLVRVGQIVQGTVTFLNAGNDILHITNASLTQVSTKFTITAYDRSVLPGATGTVQIAYSPTMEKLDSAFLSFNTDDPTNTSVTMLVTGNGILPHMSVANNRQTVDLGQVKVNSNVMHDFTITNNGSTYLNLTSITAAPLPFSVVAKPTTIGSINSGNVTVAFAPTSTGLFRGTLVIAGDDPSNPSDTIFLTGTGINSALLINPLNLNFGSVPVLTTVLDTIRLSNTGAASLNINSYQLMPQSGAFTIVQSSATQINPGGTGIVIVSFRPDTAGNYSGILTMTTDDATLPTRTVNLAGIGVKGQLVVLPSSIEFGNVKLGHDSVIRVWLKNIGQASLTISSSNITVGEFSHGTLNNSTTINAGDSIFLDLTFLPTVTGSANGSVGFVLGDQTSVNLAMHGEGASAAAVGTLTRPLDFTLSISPNPATRFVTAHISMPQASDGEIKIFDLTGHELVQMPLGLLEQGTYDITLPIERLVSGTYYVRITNSFGDAAGTKLILQR